MISEGETRAGNWRVGLGQWKRKGSEFLNCGARWGLFQGKDGGDCGKPELRRLFQEEGTRLSWRGTGFAIFGEAKVK